MAKTALYPGSFDPPTYGHLNIIEKAAALFDTLLVGVFVNPCKGSSFFSLEERECFLRDITKPFKNVRIVSSRGLLSDFVGENKVDLIVRGLSGAAHFEREKKRACANYALGCVETVFLISDPRYESVSSSLVREIGHLGGDLSSFVPEAIAAKVADRLRK